MWKSLLRLLQHSCSADGNMHMQRVEHWNCLVTACTSSAVSMSICVSVATMVVCAMLTIPRSQCICLLVLADDRLHLYYQQSCSWLMRPQYFHHVQAQV